MTDVAVDTLSTKEHDYQSGMYKDANLQKISIFLSKNIASVS